MRNQETKSGEGNVVWGLVGVGIRDGESRGKKEQRGANAESEWGGGDTGPGPTPVLGGSDGGFKTLSCSLCRTQKLHVKSRPELSRAHVTRHVAGQHLRHRQTRAGRQGRAGKARTTRHGACTISPVWHTQVIWRKHMVQARMPHSHAKHAKMPHTA